MRLILQAFIQTEGVATQVVEGMMTGKFVHAGSEFITNGRTQELTPIICEPRDQRVKARYRAAILQNGDGKCRVK